MHRLLLNDIFKFVNQFIDMRRAPEDLFVRRAGIIYGELGALLEDDGVETGGGQPIDEVGLEEVLDFGGEEG